jgi:hypothetical protein
MVTSKTTLGCPEGTRDGVCYLYRGARNPAAIVLVIIEGDKVTWIETQTSKGSNAIADTARIESCALEAFVNAGFRLRGADRLY